MSAEAIDIDLIFDGNGIDEVGIDKKTNKEIIKINPTFFRPAEVDLLIGDYTKAKKILNWEPSTNLEQLCELMALTDLKRNEANISF